MANEEHVKRLKQGVDDWNKWRRNNWTVRPDLRGAYLGGADLFDANLRGAKLSKAILAHANLYIANLSGAELHRAILRTASLQGADLTNANLTHANLIDANLSGANLSEADLRDAGLFGANLTGARLNATNLTEADLGEGTVFADVDLSSVIGLETCSHLGPSTIDHRTLQKSGQLPLNFLRGVGLPDNFINYLPSQAVQLYSCFISYSAKDQNFAERLHADLQNKGVRCWFAPHDMPIGGKIRDEINAGIRLRDKLLLILSEHSIKSNWVEDEIEQAFEEEQKRDQVVLFPVCLDEEVKTTAKAWASKLRRARHIGDFTRWKDHDARS